jgi:hypothetical protein
VNQSKTVHLKHGLSTKSPDNSIIKFRQKSRQGFDLLKNEDHPNQTLIILRVAFFRTFSSRFHTGGLPPQSICQTSILPTLHLHVFPPPSLVLSMGHVRITRRKKTGLWDVGGWWFGVI